MLTNIWRVGVRRTGTDSFQWCPVTGQGATGANWSRGRSSWMWGRTSSLWGWQSTGTGCLGRLWILLLWRHSRPAWTRSCAACCRWPCFGRGVGLDDPQRSLPTLNILWCYASVSLWVHRGKRRGNKLSRRPHLGTIFFLAKLMLEAMGHISSQPLVTLCSSHQLICSFGLWLQLCSQQPLHPLVFTTTCTHQVRNPSNRWIIWKSLRYFIFVGNIEKYTCPILSSFTMACVKLLSVCLKEQGRTGLQRDSFCCSLLSQRHWHWATWGTPSPRTQTHCLRTCWHLATAQPCHQPHSATSPAVPPAPRCHGPCGATSPVVPPASSCHGPHGATSPMVLPARRPPWGSSPQKRDQRRWAPAWLAELGM